MVQLNYREEGSGSPLVLVHGSPGDSRSWGRVVPHLREHFRVIAVDLPGYGKSPRIDDQPSGRVARIGARLAEVIEMHDAPVIVAGHSFGGVVALQAALQAPAGAVTKLVLFEPVFMRGLELVGDPALEAVRAHFDDYVARVAIGEDGAISRMVDYWFGEGSYSQMPMAVRAYLDANASLNALDVRSVFNDLVKAEQLAAFSASVVVACGDRSPDVVGAISQAILRLVPNADLKTIAGANHGMLDTHPQAVAELIRA